MRDRATELHLKIRVIRVIRWLRLRGQRITRITRISLGRGSVGHASLAPLYFSDHSKIPVDTFGDSYILPRRPSSIGATVFFLPINLVGFSPKSSPEARRGLLSVRPFEARRWVPFIRKYPFDIGAFLSHFVRAGQPAIDENPSGSWRTGRS